MKNLKLRFLALCALVVLGAAALAPMAAKAGCPAFPVGCPNGGGCNCQGTSDGHGHCSYDAACLNGGCCGQT